MQVFIRTLALAFALGILAIALGLFSTHPAGAAGSAPVMVTNTPLPVQGTVGAAQSGPWSVGVTGSVNATQSGPWSVGINGTPSVNVLSMPPVSLAGTPGIAIAGTPTVNLGPGNTVGISGPVQVSNDAVNPALVRDVDNPGRSPIQARLCVQSGTVLASCFGVPDAFSVPTGKRFVIEFVSGTCQFSPPGSGLRAVAFFTVVDGTTAEHSLITSEAFSDATHTVNDFGQQTRIYADPETAVTLIHPAFSEHRCGMTLSGYLVNP